MQITIDLNQIAEFFSELNPASYLVPGIACWYVAAGKVIRRVFPLPKDILEARVVIMENGLLWVFSPILAVGLLLWPFASILSGGVIPPPWSKKND